MNEKRGRKPLENGPKKTQNVTLDMDVLPLIHKAQDKLEQEIGFRPNISQTIKVMFKRLGEN